jgi:hypothetical protein
MRDATVVILIAVAILVSGCTGGNNSDENAADHSVACSSMGINVPYANGESVQVVNIGEGSFGNITVTWNYVDGGKLTREFEMPEAQTSATFDSGSSGRIRGAMAIHQDCPSVTESY